MGIEVQGNPEHKWQYLDREKIEDLGLDWYDLKARGYESVLGRFHSVDPKPDEGDQESLSTYQYGLNNPILRNDPNGDCVKCWEAIKSWFNKPLSALEQETGRAYMQSMTGRDITPTTQGGLILATIGYASQRMAGSVPGSNKIRIPRRTPPKKGDFIFRGDERSERVIFKEGFKSKGEDLNLEQHVKYNSDESGYISTTKSSKVAASGDYGDYVYTIRKPKNSRDVNQEMGEHKFSYEQEIAIPHMISPEDIMGVRKVGTNGKFNGPFIKNPNFKPQN